MGHPRTNKPLIDLTAIEREDYRIHLMEQLLIKLEDLEKVLMVLTEK